MKHVISLLGWIGVVLVVAAVIIRFARPDLPQWSQGLALAGLLVTVLYTLTQWRDIARSLGGRGVRYGSMAVTSAVLVLGILVAINWLGSRHNKRWDLTEASQFSLSDQTVQILRSLKKPVTIRVFYTGSSQAEHDRLDEYTYHSSQVTVDYIDAERNPLDARRYEITTVPSYIIEYDGRTERANANREQTITNALKRVIEGQPKTIYFLQGHGEPDPMGSDADGYSTLVTALQNDNFTVEPLTLVQQGAVPADATLVVVAGPKTDLLPAELDALRAFLRRGGKLQLLIDPPDQGKAPDVTGLIALAREWGIDVGNNLLIDASGLGQLLGTSASVPVAMPISHPITNNFGVMTAFPLARSVQPIEGGTNGHVAQAFLQTSPQSWAEANVATVFATGRVERNVNPPNIAGPVSLAAAVSAAAEEPATPPAGEGETPADDAPKPETRVVVVGDSDFARNGAIGIQGNREIFLNMANWLAQQEDLIAIRPTDPANRPVTMTASQGSAVFWFTMAIVPLLLFANAFRLYWRRRA
ncbi:MAG: hypothetical protein ABS36_14035 [Acidobacteria bacterium SCN 69-37]|nr:MAG: hypothetical protein ABS36_14035 [Acidobacteria bacterium SCN 69-37]